MFDSLNLLVFSNVEDYGHSKWFFFFSSPQFLFDVFSESPAFFFSNAILKSFQFSTSHFEIWAIFLCNALKLFRFWTPNEWCHMKWFISTLNGLDLKSNNNFFFWAREGKEYFLFFFYFSLRNLHLSSYGT